MKKKSKRLIGYRVGRVFAVAVAGGLLVTSAASGSTSGSTKASIPVGGETSLTGTFSTFGAQALQGMEAGVYAVNHAGGVLGGRQLNLVVADDVSDPVDAVPPAKKLVNVNHVVFENGNAGGQAQAVNKIFTAAHIPFLMPGGDTFFDQNTNKYIWRLSPSDSQLGVAMAAWARHLGYTRAAVLFRAGDVAQSIVPVVTAAFKHLGGTITSSQIVQPDLASYNSEVGKLLASKPQVIFSETDPPTESVIFRDLAAAGNTTLPTIGTDDMVGAAMQKGIGIPTSMKLMTNLEAGSFSNPAMSPFTAAVKAATHSAPQAGAQNTYDGIIIGALAIVEAKSTSGPAINNAIPKITAPGGVPVYSFAQGVKELRAGKRITYLGASGSFYFNQYHNVFGPFVAVVATASGSYKTLMTLTATDLKKATP